MKFNKKIFKITVALISILILSLTFSNSVFAGLTSRIKPNENATKSFKGAMEIIIGLFQVAAIGIASIMLIVLGIRYVSSAPNEKAEIKKHATVYLVGACIAFGASGLIQIFKGLVKESLK